MGAPPIRLKWLDFIQGVMGATGRGAATFHQDPSGGGLAGAKEAVGRMDAPSRPEVGLTVDGGHQGDIKVPGWVPSPHPERSERDCALESGKFGSPRDTPCSNHAVVCPCTNGKLPIPRWPHSPPGTGPWPMMLPTSPCSRPSSAGML